MRQDIFCQFFEEIEEVFIDEVQAVTDMVEQIHDPDEDMTYRDGPDDDANDEPPAVKKNHFHERFQYQEIKAYNILPGSSDIRDDVSDTSYITAGFGADDNQSLGNASITGSPWGN